MTFLAWFGSLFIQTPGKSWEAWRLLWLWVLRAGPHSVWDRALDTPGDTWRHLSLPIPTFQHGVVGENLGQGVSEKLPQGIRVSHTSIQGHIEHIQPAKDKETPEKMSARWSARLIKLARCDNIWSTSCWWNRNNQVQFRVNDWFLFYIHLLKLPQIYTFRYVLKKKKKNEWLLNTM